MFYLNQTINYPNVFTHTEIRLTKTPYPPYFDQSESSTYSNEALNCSSMYQEFLKDNELSYDSYFFINNVRLSATFLLVILSCLGNIFILVTMDLCQNGRRTRLKLSNDQIIKANLIAANLAFTFFVLVHDAAWHITIQWLAGDFLCRLLNMLKQFSIYISSAIPMVMGIEKAVCLVRGFDAAQQRQLVTRLLSIAWTVSFANSLPAAVMYSAKVFGPSLEKCSSYTVVQCIDFAVVEKDAIHAFYLYSMLISFFIPMACIVISNAIVLMKIAELTKDAKEREGTLSEVHLRSRRKGMLRRMLTKTKKRSALSSILITSTYIICWLPYYTTGITRWFGYEPVDKMAETLMLLSSYLTPSLYSLIVIVMTKEIRKNFKCVSTSTREPTISPQTVQTELQPL